MLDARVAGMAGQAPNGALCLPCQCCGLGWQGEGPPRQLVRDVVPVGPAGAVRPDWAGWVWCPERPTTPRRATVAEVARGRPAAVPAVSDNSLSTPDWDWIRTGRRRSGRRSLGRSPLRAGL